MKKRPTPAQVIEAVGGMYSRELGIGLSKQDAAQGFRWLLAAKLMGARIATATALSTWKEFDRGGVDTPEAVGRTGWDGLVALLDRGGYARYDFSTATKLLAIAGDLLGRYGGDLNILHDRSAGPRDLEARLTALGKGIGPVTANIFLREMRAAWPKADPALSPLAAAAARDLGFAGKKGSPMDALRAVWAADPARGYFFADLETALVRLGKDYCRKPRVARCPMGAYCPRLRSFGSTAPDRSRRA